MVVEHFFAPDPLRLSWWRAMLIGVCEACEACKAPGFADRCILLRLSDDLHADHGELERVSSGRTAGQRYRGKSLPLQTQR